MARLEDYEVEEIWSEREAIEAEQEAERLAELQVESDLFADTWNAEPFDTSELNVTQDMDELPEWMFG